MVVTAPGVTVCLDKEAKACSDYEGNALTESYQDSFCSYHSAYNPGGNPDGDGNTLLYDVLPYVASGFKLGSVDCQDGGFDPTNKEKKEKAREENAKEKEEFAEKDAEEKEAILKQARWKNLTSRSRTSLRPTRKTCCGTGASPM